VKIPCVCGQTIVDSDESSWKGHLVPDQDLFGLLDAIDRAIELSGPSPQEKETACMHVRHHVTQASKLVWQCASCGRLYIDGHNGELQIFQPSTSNTQRKVLASRLVHGNLSSLPDA
jgi:hypothetical protein